MKTIKSIVTLFVLTLAFTTVSCDDEPIDPAINPQFDSVLGTYTMTAFNSSVQTDLNDDGTRSTNQMDETNCFDGNTLILNADNTFIATSKGIDIVTNGTSEVIECFVDSDITGTWSITSNFLSLTYTESGTEYTDIFSISGNRLTHSISNTEVVGTTSAGEPVYLNSDIQIVYSK